MRLIFIPAILLAIGSSAATAWGHGFNISLSGNTIVPDTEAIPALYTNLFQAAFSDTVQNNHFSTQYADHGSVDDTDGGFPAGSTFRFDVVSPLFFSNGNTPPVPVYVDPTNPNHDSHFSDQSVRLSISDADQISPTINLFGNASTTAGFSILADDAHELDHYLYNWSVGGGNGDGAYGFAFRVSGEAPDHTQFSSGPLVDVFYTTNYVLSSQQQQLNNAAVAIYSRSTLLPGDLSQDGFVGQADLNLILNHWGQHVSAGSLALGDWSGDGFVGQADLNAVLNDWGAGTPPSASSLSAVPEPSSLALLSIAGVALTIAALSRCRS